jgi:hypothetical protein
MVRVHWTSMDSKTSRHFARALGAMLVGSLSTDRGTADLYLDGALASKIDGYNDDGYRGSEGLWGKFDLSRGTHTVRIVVNGQPYSGSKDAWMNLEGLIVYRK